MTAPSLSEPPAAVAFLGCGWPWSDTSTGVVGVPEAAICARHERWLSSEPVRAQAEATATLNWIDAQLRRGLSVVGYLGYEIGASLEQIPAGLRHPHKQSGGGSEAQGVPDAALMAMAEDALSPLGTDGLSVGNHRFSGFSEPATTNSDLPTDLLRQHGAYVAAVEQALVAIATGRYYQINLSVGFEVPSPVWLHNAPLGDALQSLSAPQPVPFAMAIQVGAHRIFCLSMERFLSVRPDRSDHKLTVRSRPIKGTAPRGITPALDDQIRRELLSSTKERAENTMIVDMVRNDLSRVATLGSVEVATLLEAVPYETLWHLESEVCARLAARPSAADLLHATLPPASVTGCPKVAAMTAIAALENRCRGPYCGALGLWRPDGYVDLAVGIRTMVAHEQRVHLDVGAGIVADSQAEAEWLETCLKAQGALRGLSANQR